MCIQMYTHVTNIHFYKNIGPLNKQRIFKNDYNFQKRKETEFEKTTSATQKYSRVIKYSISLILYIKCSAKHQMPPIIFCNKWSNFALENTLYIYCTWKLKGSITCV